MSISENTQHIKNVIDKHNERNKRTTKLFKWFLIFLAAYVFIIVLSLVTFFFWDIPWLYNAIELFTGTANVLSIWFCGTVWRDYYRNSKIDEQEQTESRKRLEETEKIIESQYRERGLPYEPNSLLSYPWFNHKRARFQLGLLYACCIIINIVLIIWILSDI